MTQWQEFPLRPEGRPWPGLNTRGGRLDNGTGQLEDGSIGMIINEADVLEKRKGLVRGLNEHFDGVVCGLFKYTDECGREFLLVADEDQINIRQPFEIPVFENSDAYPFDSFSDLLIDPLNWRNITDYESSIGEMRQRAGLPAIIGLRVASSDIMRWFKEASNKSYQTRIQYRVEDEAVEQHMAIVIKGNGSLNTGALLQGEIVFDNRGTYQVRLFHRDAADSVTEILREELVGQRTGFFTVQYSRNAGTNTFLPGVQVFPTGGVPVVQNATGLNAIQDADLGQVTGIGLGYRDGAQPMSSILVVDGGPI